MVQDDIDLALRYGVPDSEMVARVLAPSRRVVCAAPSLIAQMAARPRRKLAQLPTLVLCTALGPMQEWRYRSNDAADERRRYACAARSKATTVK
jgi:DNA-binding transcriptional LysR family regulator